MMFHVLDKVHRKGGIALIAACVDCYSYDLKTGECGQKDTIDLNSLFEKIENLKEQLSSPH